MTQNNTIDKDKVKIEKSYYDSGAIYSEAPYKNGKIHGIVKGYRESGALWRETPYVNGERHGIEKRYYESGTLHWVTPYVDGKIQGIKKVYVEDTQEIYRTVLYNRERTVLTLYKVLSITAIKFNR